MVLFLVGPALLAPWARYAGNDSIDGIGTRWYFWWLGRALRRGASLAHTDLLFYPWGKDLFLHTGGNFVDALLVQPLRWALGDVVAWNAWVSLVIAGNAWVGGRLARALGAGEWGRFAAASSLAANPFTLFEVGNGRPTQGLLWFAGLWVASLAEPPTVRRGLMGGVWLALAGMTYWFFGFLGAVAGAATLVVRLVAGPRRGREALRIGLAAMVSSALVLPLVAPMLEHLASGQVPGLLALAEEPGPLGHLRLADADGQPLGLYVLALDGRVGGLFREGVLRFKNGVRQLYWLQPMLIVAGVVAMRRRALALVAWGAAAWLFALGPAIVAGHRFVANPLYIFPAEHLPFMRRWWWPGRSVAFIHLAAAGLGGGVVSRLPKAWRPWTACGVAALSVGIVVAAGLAPLSYTSADVPQGVRCIAKAPPGNVIEIPFAHGQRNLRDQRVHGRPTLNGMLVNIDAFLPAGFKALRRQNSFVRWMLAVGERDYRGAPRPTDADRAELVDLGFRYVIVQKDAFIRARPAGGFDSDWSRARRVLNDVLGQPDWDGEQVAIYTLSGPHLRCADGGA